jgi:ACS family tartrate transporter-like MFS transporter
MNEGASVPSGLDAKSGDFERHVMRRITLRLIPFLCACYLAAFLDRVNVGFAKLQMVRDLKFTNAVYGLGAGIFFIGYFLFEIPSNLILEKVGARIWIARIMVMWGAISFCMMFVSNAAQFYTLRFLLGAAEAGFFPGIILYLTYWFPSAHRSRTIAVFMTAAVMSSVVGSPLSGWLLQLGGTFGLRGWQWLFVVEALPSIMLGAVVLLVLPNDPREAKWLRPGELGWLEGRLQAERRAASANRSPTFAAALAQPRVILSCLAYLALCIGGYGLDFFQPTLVHESFPTATPLGVGFINAVPPFLALFVMVVWGRSSDRRAERKVHFAVAIWVAAAGLLLASLRLPSGLALAALTIAVSGRWSSVAPFWGFTTTFLSGTAAAGAIALINSVGNLGGFAGPYLMGWLKDLSGDYRVGLRVLAAVMFAGGFIVLRVQGAGARSAETAGPDPEPQAAGS